MRQTALRRLRLALAAGTALATVAGGAQALPVLAQNPPQVNPGGGQPVISQAFSQTGPVLTVDLNAPRTIIDWSSFNVLANETVDFGFDSRNGVVLNRVNGPAINIDGRVRGLAPGANPIGGNVWFYSPNGMIVGATGRVDAGGVLATSSAFDAAEFLNPANFTFNLTGSGAGGGVTVRGGGRIGSTGGSLAIVGPAVTTEAGAALDAPESELVIGAADSFRIRFIQGFNSDLELVDFIVPNRASGTPVGTPISLAGTTRGMNVSMMVVSRAAVAGLLINAPGLITAQRSALHPGGGAVNISGNRSMTNRQTIYGANGAIDNRVAGATVGAARFGDINAAEFLHIVMDSDRDLGDLTTGALRSGANTIVAGDDVTVQSVDAGRDPPPTGQQFRQAIFGGSGVIRVGQAFAQGGFVLGHQDFVAGRNLPLPTGVLGDVSAGTITIFSVGDVTAGALSAGNSIQGGTGTGSLTFASMSAPSINISARNAFNVGRVNSADVMMGAFGSMTIDTVLAGRFRAAVNDTVLRVNNLTATGELALEATFVSIGTARAGADSRIGVVSGLTIDNELSAPNLTLNSFAGPIGLGVPGGVTNETFGRIRVQGRVDIYGGVTACIFCPALPTQRGDAFLGDLTVDSAKIPELNIFVGRDNDAFVLGTVAPAGAGGIIRIGEAAADGVWTPRSIQITGSLGAARGDAVAGFTDVRGFGQVQLNARQDIFMGSQRFIDLVETTPAAQIDIGRGQPAGVAAEGDEVGRLFVVSGLLGLNAGDRIVQQNTGVPGLEGGLYLTGAGVPPTDPLLVIGRAQVADLFGAFDSGGGSVLAFGGAGALSSRIARAAGDTNGGQIRINGCLLGVGCALSTPSTQFRVQQFEPAAPQASVDPPVLTPPPPVEDDERESETVVTGAGNEEIWRRDR